MTNTPANPARHLARVTTPLLRQAAHHTIAQAGTSRIGPRLTRSFFTRDAVTVARELIGAILIRRHARITRRARIVETEAYVGPHDLACHAAKGRTNRTDVMFLPGGHAYVYFIYGMYDMLNVVTGKKDDPQAVLIRAAEPLDGWNANLSGPGKLTRALHITRKDNRADLTRGNLCFLARTHTPRIRATPRIGVDYAKHWKDEHLRFIDADSKAVSGPRTMTKGLGPVPGTAGLESKPKRRREK